MVSANNRIDQGRDLVGVIVIIDEWK
jgi:hypothetical protein